MTYRLVVEKGRSKGKGLRLNGGAAVVVGRDASCTLRVVDAQASRKHFKVFGKGDEFVVEDLQSSNGTFVNGKRIDSKHMLRAGDKVQLGETLVYFLEELQSEDGGTPSNPIRKGELTGKDIEGYRIGRLLGRGGMGTVYEAQQLSLERTVAFKVLAQELADDPALIERFVAEARAAGRLSHANIVAVFHVGQSGKQYFYSMEYMAGGSVEDLLRREGKLDVPRSIPIVFDAARGLEYAERHGLIHRDIKPANLMLGHDEVTKICDLGIATWQPGPQDACGSPHYVAPEQALGQPVDHRADLYALGVSWYHMLAGDTPFQGQSAKEIVLKHVNEEPPPLAEKGVPEDVAVVVHKLMAKKPADRIQTARQLQADLAELARRYPVRETVMLRIDSVAPEDAPSAELLPPEPEGEPAAQPATRAAVWAAVAFVAIGVMVAAFIGTTLISRKAHAQAVADARLKIDALRGRAASRELPALEAARDEATALAAQLETDGLAEPAREAKQVAEDAEKRRVELREATARARYKEAEALANVPAGPPDEASVERLQRALAALSAVANEAPDTESGKKARDLAVTVAGRLEELRQAVAEHQARERAAMEAFDRTKQTVAGLLTGSRGDRFKLAAERARELERDHGGSKVAVEGAKELLARIRRGAEDHAAAEITAAVRLIPEERFSDARLRLEALLGGALGFPDLEVRVRDQLAALDNAERSARQQQASARQRELQEKVRKALERIAPERQARTFGRAASALRAEAALLPAEVRAQLEARATRLEAAARAIDELVRRVNDGSCRFAVDIEFAGKTQTATVTEAERGADGIRFTFEHEPGRGRTLPLTTLSWGQLSAALDSVELTPDAKVDLACLGFELDARADGVNRLMRLQTDSAVKDRVRVLLELAAAEQP